MQKNKYKFENHYDTLVSIREFPTFVASVKKEVEDINSNPPKNKITKKSKYFVKDKLGWYIL
jgi:hypothetical protein